MDGKQSLKLTDREIAAAFADSSWAERFPPVMSLDQAVELLQIPKATLYDWRSRGLLGSCSAKWGNTCDSSEIALSKLSSTKV